MRQVEMTSADLHDSQRGLAMIQSDEQAYYGDKAYDSEALRNALKDKGIDDEIAYKGKRGKAQPDWQKSFNKTASSVRVGVERANATMKNWYGMAKVRYRAPGALQLPPSVVDLHFNLGLGAFEPIFGTSIETFAG